MNKLMFDAETHTYTLDGEVLPSVTHLCRFLTFDTAAGADKHMRDVAAARGARIHEECMMFDYEGDEILGTLDNDIVGYVQAYADFCRDYQIAKWELIERPLTDGVIAGTPDRYGTIDGELAVLDIKTGTKVNVPYTQAQLYAYGWLLKCNGFEQPTQAWCLQLKKDGKYRLFKWQCADGRRAFMTSKNLHEIISKKKEK